MQGWYQVSEVANALGVSKQTIRNWIAKGDLTAAQGTSRGSYRIPGLELDAFKRRTGLLPPVETALAPTEDLTNPDTLYRERIAPVLCELKASSAEDVLRRMAREPGLRISYSRFPTLYLAYVQALVEEDLDESDA